MNAADTPGWQFAAFAVLALVVVGNYLVERARARRRPVVVVAPAPVPAREKCAVVVCPDRATRGRKGWKLCDDHYGEYVEAARPRTRVPA